MDWGSGEKDLASAGGEFATLNAKVPRAWPWFVQGPPFLEKKKEPERLPSTP
jgi:hypothetical protein